MPSKESVATLDALPNELLALVTSHFAYPQDVVNLSLSNHRLYRFTQLDGWRAFLKGRFGLSGPDGDTKTAVHGLTTLYRNWERKAFLARYLEPGPHVTDLELWRVKTWSEPVGQTMGYQSSIDSFEISPGGWTQRKEVMAWSAGSQIVVRQKGMGRKTNKAQSQYHEEQETECGAREPTDLVYLDHFQHQSLWYTYKIPDSVEGRDDITTLKLFRPHQKEDELEHIAFGTASGELTVLSANMTMRETERTHYATKGRPVKSLSVSSSKKPLLAAVLGDTSLSLYPSITIEERGGPQLALSELSIARQPSVEGLSLSGQIWSCSFITENKVALGIGPSTEPIRIYEVTPTGFPALPLRTFSLRDTDRGGPTQNTSVYPIVPLPSILQDTAEGHTFLSGAYDGIVRLHDMRSPRPWESIFHDVTNDSPVFSLACQGLEHIVVGSNSHSMLKVFDIRLPGSHAYRRRLYSMPSHWSKRRQDHTINRTADATPSLKPGGWNLFLNPRKPIQQNGNRRSQRPNRQTRDCPVYSISIPSPTSPTVYAGLEGAVQALTFHSVTDAHPDPLLSQNLTFVTGTDEVNIKATYNPADDVLNLGMYEQCDEKGLGMQLLVQDEVSHGVGMNEKRKQFARSRGLDERWKDPNEEGERWVRGIVPEGPAESGQMHQRTGRRAGRRRGGT